MTTSPTARKSPNRAAPRAGAPVAPRRASAPTRWSARSWKEMEAYVAQAADVLHLKDWTIELSQDSAGDDAYASISPLYGQKRATLRLGPAFLTQGVEDQRQTIAHELIHCHLFGGTEVVRRTNEQTLSEEVAAVAWIGYISEIEYATDALADAMAPLLPLPWGL